MNHDPNKLATEYVENEKHIEILKNRNIDIIFLMRKFLSLEGIGNLIGMTKQGVYKIINKNSR